MIPNLTTFSPLPIYSLDNAIDAIINKLNSLEKRVWNLEHASNVSDTSNVSNTSNASGTNPVDAENDLAKEVDKIEKLVDARNITNPPKGSYWGMNAIK